MRRVLILCKSEVKNTFEQIFEVGAAGAENHLVDIFIYFIYIQGVFGLVRSKNDQVPDPWEILTPKFFLWDLLCYLTLRAIRGRPIKNTLYKPHFLGHDFSG